MIIIPDNIIQQLQMFCEGNNLGLARIVHRHEDIHILLIGTTKISPEVASIMAAELLLHGVTSGKLTKANDESEDPPTSSLTN